MCSYSRRSFCLCRTAGQASFAGRIRQGTDNYNNHHVALGAEQIISLRVLLLQTLGEVRDLEEECVVLSEILVRKKFKTISEARPTLTKEKRRVRRSSAEIAEMMSSALKAKASVPPAEQAAVAVPSVLSESKSPPLPL